MILNTAFPRGIKASFTAVFICCFICVFASLVNKVSLQVTVEAVFGGSVVLPFSSAQHDHKPRDIDVYWRHNGSKIVFDIIKGKASVDQQDPRYKNRVETFPEEYLRGNFSLKLINLQHTDAGKYTCLISHSSKHETVELIIKESTEKGNKTNDQEKPNQAETTQEAFHCSHNVPCFSFVGRLMAGVLKYQEDVPQHLRRPQTEVSQGKGAIAQDQVSLLMLEGQTGGGFILKSQTEGGLMLKGQTGGGLMLKSQTAGGLMLKGQTGGGLMLKGQTGGGLMLEGQTGGGLMLEGSTLKAKAWLMHTHQCLQGSLPMPQASEEELN
ncbi:hypothetical protein G5714_021855 [Onychostoma macrolepis]|uniref:Ig-like domain-containing protein n=1 Tax=Onychostoma macrolepis TaxID=369639 RepID=A0A7J6BS72_9TELE|nr:hypothetical protein G5714_021855 [Onychostoma macrolepis]